MAWPGSAAPAWPQRSLVPRLVHCTRLASTFVQASCQHEHAGRTDSEVVVVQHILAHPNDGGQKASLPARIAL